MPKLRKKLQTKIEEAYHLLTPEQKDVWDLVMKSGLSQYQAASQLGISRNAVDRRLYWAKTKFRTVLKDYAN